MTALRLNLRVWATGPGLPAAGGLAALILAAAILTVWASIRTGIPLVNIVGVMLLVLALGGSYITTLMLPTRPCRRRVVNAPARGRGPAPRAAFARGGAARGAFYAPGRLPYGRAKRPAAAPAAPPAAGPTHLTATIPAGGPL